MRICDNVVSGGLICYSEKNLLLGRDPIVASLSLLRQVPQLSFTTIGGRRSSAPGCGQLCAAHTLHLHNLPQRSLIPHRTSRLRPSKSVFPRVAHHPCTVPNTSPHTSPHAPPHTPPQPSPRTPPHTSPHTPRGPSVCSQTRGRPSASPPPSRAVAAPPSDQLPDGQHTDSCAAAAHWTQ